ncbi:MFS transporter [Thalassospira sp.]|uniref:MFS transporter n=1 Tax=Thalassospira sp. TaxID=1912094 RepID=UPI003AA9009B
MKNEPVTRRSGLFPKGTIWVLLLVSVVALCIALVGISWRAADLARDDLRSETIKKATIEAQVLVEKIARALDLGIPLDKITGFDDLIVGMQDGDPDLLFGAILTSDGQVLFSGGLAPAVFEKSLSLSQDDQQKSRFILTRLPLKMGDGALEAGDTRLGSLVIGHDRRALMRPLIDNLFDIGVILLIALALSFELMLLVLTVNVTMPVRVASRVLANIHARKFTLLHGQSTRDDIGQFMGRINAVVANTAQKAGIIPQPAREVRLVGVRMLAFMFVLAEELARPIMPAYFSDLTAHAMGGQLGAGIVMAVHLLMIAIAMPLCSLIQGKTGPLRMYLIGACLATVGLFGAASAVGFWDLVIWRALSGLGYATTFVACQSYVLDATTEKNRSQGTAMMVSGIMLADICGPAIGGIIAGYFGASLTFFMGGFVAVFATGLAFFLMDSQVGLRGDMAPALPTRAAFGALLRNRRLQVVMVFAAIPAKLILSAFLYYLVPVLMLQSGATIAEIGRVIMLYGMVALLSGWGVARWTDRKQQEMRAVGIGGVITAIGLVMAGIFPAGPVIAVAVGMLGLSQATSIPAQVSLSLKLSRTFTEKHGTGPVLAVLRLAERFGGASGPLIAAMLVHYFGPEKAILYLGCGAVICILCFEVLIGRSPVDKDIADKAGVKQ